MDKRGEWVYRQEMSDVITLRRAGPRDAEAISALLRTCYGRLYRDWYPDEAVDRAVSGLSRARPELLVSGRYRIAEIEGEAVSVGGWSARPGGRTGHLRLFGTHPDHLGRGAASAVLRASLEEAWAEGAVRMECVASLPAEPFYAKHGFETVDFALQPAPGGALFGVALMKRPFEA